MFLAFVLLLSHSVKLSEGFGWALTNVYGDANCTSLSSSSGNQLDLCDSGSKVTCDNGVPFIEGYYDEDCTQLQERYPYDSPETENKCALVSGVYRKSFCLSSPKIPLPSNFNVLV
jgi:hypothetical protein